MTLFRRLIYCTRKATGDLRTSVLLLGAALACTSRDQLPYRLTSQQSQVVNQMASQNPGWRVATAADNSDSVSLRELRSHNVGFEPYVATFQRGNAESDLAFALVRDSTFKIFYSRYENGVYLPAQEVTTVNWLRTGRIRLRRDTLDVAPFKSDEIFEFVWSLKLGSLEFVREPGDSTIK